MVQFSYKEWEKNPKREVVTRKGEKVIIRGYVAGNIYPVKVERADGSYDYYTDDGVFIRGGQDERDLFFAYDSVYIPQSETTNGLCWRKCKAGYKFPSDAIVIPQDSRTEDTDPRLVRCAVWDSIYILVADLKKLPTE